MNKYYWIKATEGERMLFEGRVLKSSPGAAVKAVSQRVGRAQSLATRVYELPVPLLREIVTEAVTRERHSVTQSNEKDDGAQVEPSSPVPAPEASSPRFLAVLRDQIRQAKNWPRKPDLTLDITPPGHGWLLPVLIECESRCWGRWDHWLRTMEAGRILDEPIPQIQFAPHEATLARKMHEKSLDSIARYGGWQGWGSWRLFDYYLDWLLYGFGDHRQKEPPVEPEPGAFSRLYQVFCMEAMIAWPADLFGDLLAENRHGRGAGFFPTPHNVVELMTRMTFPPDADNRLQTFHDPCVGTGRMPLHASNHTYRLSAQDVNDTVLKACIVNGYCFAPWLVRPFPFIDEAQRAKASESIHNNGFTLNAQTLL